MFAGRFELIDPIGSGGTGTVWRAWDRRLERLCAAKVLRQRHAGVLLRFVREQGRRLDHPNILSPYGWAADDDQALLAMELVGGGSVSTLLSDFGPLPDRYAAELLAQLLAALARVHSAGLVHRDVKPANLLLEATGINPPVLRLSDFGIALSLDEPRLTHQGAVVGTPGYLAPETLAGEPPSTAQDLYAVGVTAWQLLTGDEPPSEHPLPPPSTSTPLWSLVEPLLSANAADRTSAESALAALAPLLARPLAVPARTADGEPIEVFDHLAPLPSPHEHLAPAPVVAAPEPVARETGGVARETGEQERVPRRLVGRRGILAAVVVAALAGAGVAGVLVFDDPPEEGGGPSTERSTPTPTPTQETPVVVPTGAVTPKPNPSITIGGGCGWQEAGSLETVADGTRVECRQQGTSYRWVKVG
ncbi:hypothetical protein BWI15_06345 [Kribbella sp. ALI-6-A]|nr:hypothetical protein BWI15_06345 [Kribbella sp. ALI-6-A]